MHCDKCNVDFPEGLRYCKWCGEALADRPRITSELHSCPSCSAAIQPGWTFCKACGERLQPAAGSASAQSSKPETADKVRPDATDTTVMSTCSSCGEQLDTGSLYCKGCGSAVYTEQTPFGGSALLCGSCKSYSPLGSSVCRVCGAPFRQASRTVVDFPSGLTTVQQKAPTLPDLDEHLAAKPQPPTPEVDDFLNSGASTVVFTGRDEKSKAEVPKGAVETNLLPGTSGARSEQPAQTQIMQMGRTTGPVEADETQEAPEPSGELTDSPEPALVEPVQDKRSAPADRTVEFSAVTQTPATPPGPTTLGLASESESEKAPAGSENKTAVFVSPRTPERTDDPGTRPMSPAQVPATVEPTREFQQPSKRVTADKVAQADQVTAPAQSVSAEAGVPMSASERFQPESPTELGSQPIPKKRTGMVIASAIVVLILVGAAGYVGWLLLGRGTPTPQPAPRVEQPPIAPPPVPEKPPAPVVPEGMVALAAGNYTIGRDDGDPLEQPEHPADLPAFFIDRAEVTNAAYKAFVDATGHKPPSNWTGANFPEGRADFPVTGVSWQDAADYAAWAGKRLPTEAEWEAAARGTDRRIYPWGNGFRSGVANIGLKPDKPTPEQYPAGIKATGSYPEGASPAGAVDMIGNAWEWVADEIKVYPGNTESTLELEPGVTYRVIRGGAYDGNKVNDATYRGYLDGSLRYPKVGFRCAKDAK